MQFVSSSTTHTISSWWCSTEEHFLYEQRYLVIISVMFWLKLQQNCQDSVPLSTGFHFGRHTLIQTIQFTTYQQCRKYAGFIGGYFCYSRSASSWLCGSKSKQKLKETFAQSKITSQLEILSRWTLLKWNHGFCRRRPPTHYTMRLGLFHVLSPALFQ